MAEERDAHARIAASDPRHSTERIVTERPSSVPPPPPELSPEDAALEARIRLKLDRGERLTDEERAFFARMPADKGIAADEIG